MVQEAASLLTWEPHNESGGYFLPRSVLLNPRTVCIPLVPVYLCNISKLSLACFFISLAPHTPLVTFCSLHHPFFTARNLEQAGDKEEQQCGQADSQGQHMAAVC